MRTAKWLSVLLVVTMSAACVRDQHLVVVPKESAPCAQTCAAQHPDREKGFVRCLERCPGATELGEGDCADPALAAHAACAPRHRANVTGIVALSLGVAATLLTIFLVRSDTRVR